jgi:hypothetical protein
MKDGLFYGSSESSFKPREQILKEHETIVFPDKKRADVDYNRITAHIQEGDQIRKEMDVGQEDATWNPSLERPDRPAAAIWMTDIHYGHANTLYDQLNRHLDMVENTPNMFALIGGDIVDNFSAAKHPQAATGDVINPQMQAQSFMSRLRDLDQKHKIGAFVFGNHEDFVNMAGLDFYNTFMQGLNAPIFNRGGILRTNVGSSLYRVGLGHKHWGVSKINPENAARRAMEFSWPNTDAVLLGDDHMAAGSAFTRGGERKIVIDGGTYKHDVTGQKWGLGKAGMPGYTLLMWPNRKHMEFTHDPETAQELLK